MAQHSLLTRYTPAVIAVTGVAAAVGGYIIYTQSQEPVPHSTLHRSNAIHHRRRPNTNDSGQDQSTTIVANTDRDATLGEGPTGPSSSIVSGIDVAETEDLDTDIKGLLYHIAEEQARRKAYEHRGINCEVCGEAPIRGTRWHCLNCPDFDLCSTCEAQTVHQKTHVFVKIKIPLPVLSQPSISHPLWYPGDPRKLHSFLNARLRKSLSSEYGLDEPVVDALYDQFTCIANVPYSDDPDHVKAAIDRRAFNKALTNERWPQRFAANAMYDQMFVFYDTNNDGLIGFHEFVAGLAYLREPSRVKDVRRALQGYDLDGDGFVIRNDFLRLFRAKYTVQKQLTSDMIDSHETEQTYAAMDIIRSSQPISSIFRQEEIPPGLERPRWGKRMDAFGDMQPLADTNTILDDNEAWVSSRGSRDPPQRDRNSVLPSSETLRRHLSRFEEMLYEPESATNEATAFPEGLGSGPDDDSPELCRSVCLPYELQPRTDTLSEAIDEDVLWQVVDTGLNEMLDPMFKSKEAVDLEVARTRQERDQWRDAIDYMLEQKRAFEHELRKHAMDDPLVAEALGSYSKFDVEVKESATSEPPFRGEIVPTDQDSLMKRAKEISEQPLENLLDATGYGILGDDDGDDGHQQPRYESDEANEMLELSGDPTIPSGWESRQPRMTNSNAGSSQQVPSKKHLEHLASLDDAESEIQARGGTGRLSYDEIEAMIEADPSKELRGLVMSWLEWASF